MPSGAPAIAGNTPSAELAPPVPEPPPAVPGSTKLAGVVLPPPFTACPINPATPA